MRARSAVLDVFGDHLTPAQPGAAAWAPVSGLVALLGTLGITPPAVRTAVSRLAREGWLARESRGGIRGYAATPTLAERVATTRQRIYRDPHATWDGHWHVVVTERVPGRSERTRLAASMHFLGYAQLGTDTWVAARPSPELATALAREDVGHSAFTGPLTSLPGSLSPTPVELAAQLWDLDTLAASHRDFLAAVDQLAVGIAAAGGPAALSPAEAFSARTRLVHRWRTFLFTDPALPAALLPDDWPGHEAARRFLALSDLLRPGATAQVDLCLSD